MSFILNYGTYNCGKSSDLIKIYNNYRKKGMKPVAFNVYTNIEDKRNMIVNDMGLNCPAEPVLPDYDIYRRVLLLAVSEKIDIVLVDNGQYLSNAAILGLRKIANRGLPVVVFALRSDYTGNLYIGTKNILGIADRIVEIKGMCWCNKRASMNACINNLDNTIIRELTGEEDYAFTGVCAKHWEDGKVTSGVIGKGVYNRDSLKLYFNTLNNLSKEMSVPVSAVIAELGDTRLSHYVDHDIIKLSEGGTVTVGDMRNYENVFFKDPFVIFDSLNHSDGYCLESIIADKIRKKIKD